MLVLHWAEHDRRKWLKSNKCFVVLTFSSSALNAHRAVWWHWQKLAQMLPFWVDVVLVYIMGKQSTYFYLAVPGIDLSSDFMYAVPPHFYLLEQSKTDMVAQMCFLSVAFIHMATRVDADMCSFLLCKYVHSPVFVTQQESLVNTCLAAFPALCACCVAK